MKKKIMATILAAMCCTSAMSVPISSFVGMAEQITENTTIETPEGEKNITMEDVIELSKKNDTVIVKWSDFTEFKGEDTSSDSALWETEWTFKIDDEYTLKVCGKTDRYPDHIYLTDNNKRRIDIRTDDVKSFLNKGVGEDSLNISDEVKENFRVYEMYSDEFTKPERRLVQDFKSIMRYYNVPIRFVFTEYDNIDDILSSAYATNKYYVVEQQDGTLQCYNEHLVDIPSLDIPEKAFERFNDPDFVKKYISPDVIVDNVYYLSGETNHMGTVIYYRTNLGDYVYYNHYSIGEKLFPIEKFCKYQKAVYDMIANNADGNGGGDVDVSGVMDLSEFELKETVVSENVNGDANCDGDVNMSDAVIIMQSLANPAKYGVNGTDENHITEQGKINGDIAGNNDGITNADALAVQKKLLGLDKTDNQRIDSSFIANKVFVYEKSADPGIYDDLCDLSFGSNGIYTYHIGYYTSSNQDQGTWEISEDTLVLTGRYGTNKFRYEDKALIYFAEESDGFSKFTDKSTPKDGDKFNLAEEPDYAAINNLSEIVTIKTDYNPIMSDWSGIGILLEFDSKDYSISLRTNDGHFTTWDIAKGSGPIKNAGVTYDIGNSGYIFWTPDGFEFDADYQNEIVIIGEKDGKSVKLGSIIVTPSNNHTLTAALK